VWRTALATSRRRAAVGAITEPVAVDRIIAVSEIEKNPDVTSSTAAPARACAGKSSIRPETHLEHELAEMGSGQRCRDDQRSATAAPAWRQRPHSRAEVSQLSAVNIMWVDHPACRGYGKQHAARSVASTETGAISRNETAQREKGSAPDPDRAIGESASRDHPERLWRR
jgi:hypothetical protein